MPFVAINHEFFTAVRDQKILYSNNLINPVSPFHTCDDLILELSYTRINTVGGVRTQLERISSSNKNKPCSALVATLVFEIKYSKSHS